MKLLHSSIQLSQKVLHAIPLSSPDQNIINALLIFRNYAQKIKIDCNESVPTIFSSAIYPLGVPICHIIQFGELIAAVTADAYLVFFLPDQPFKTIMNYQLTDRISPSQIPIAHVLPSINSNYLVCCGFSKNFIAIGNMERNFEQIRIELPDFIVLGIAPGASDNIFALLVMKPNSERSVVLIDITSPQYKQIQEFNVSKDAYKIISANDGNTILAFSKKDITSLESGKTIESSQVSAHFFITPTYLIYQTINGDMHGLNTTEFKLDHLGTIHLSSFLYLLSPTLLLSVSEHSDCYFITLPTPSDHLNIQFQFNSLPKQILHFAPRIISSTFNGRSLIVASGHEHESCITQIQNTIQFSSQTLTRINLDDENTKNPQLFVTSSGSILLSSTKTVPVIGQSFNYSENPTIMIGRLNDNIIQIHRKGINVLLENGEEKVETWKRWESPEEVTCAAIGEEAVFVSLGNRGIVLDSEFNILTDKMVGKVIGAAFCDRRSVAIATKSDGTNHSAISIYSIDLNPADSEIHITSQVINMIFDQTTIELYVSTQDGFVYKLSINNSNENTDLEETVVTLFSGKVTPKIYPFADSILIFADRTFVYNDQQLLQLSATVKEAKPLTVTTSENHVYQLERDGSITVITVDEFDHDLKSGYFQQEGTPRRMANIDNMTLTVTKLREENQLNSYISILSRTVEDNEDFQNLNVQIHSNPDEQEGFEIISILAVPDTKQVILGCQKVKQPDNQNQANLFNQIQPNMHSNKTQSKDYFLKVIEIQNQSNEIFDNPDQDFTDFQDLQGFEFGNSEKTESFVPVSIQSISIGDRPNVMSYVKGVVLVGTGRHIYPMVRQEDQWSFEKHNCLASIHTQVGFIEISDNFVWVGDKTQSVICFTLITNDKNDIKLAIIASDTEPKQLTAMQITDKYEIALADKFGTISIMRLPEDIIANSTWRISQMTERGIFMPQCGHLIKIASYNVGETITSLMKSKFSDSLFYTTLLGQIGALIPIANEEDYSCLQAAENLTNQQWQKEFSLMKLRKFDHLKISVVSLDVVEQIGQLSIESQHQIENSLVANNKITVQQVLGIIAKYKTLCKF